MWVGSHKHWIIHFSSCTLPLKKSRCLFYICTGYSETAMIFFQIIFFFLSTDHNMAFTKTKSQLIAKTMMKYNFLEKIVNVMQHTKTKLQSGSRVEIQYLVFRECGRCWWWKWFSTQKLVAFQSDDQILLELWKTVCDILHFGC